MIQILFLCIFIQFMATFDFVFLLLDTVFELNALKSLYCEVHRETLLFEIS